MSESPNPPSILLDEIDDPEVVKLVQKLEESIGASPDITATVLGNVATLASRDGARLIQFDQDTEDLLAEDLELKGLIAAMKATGDPMERRKYLDSIAIRRLALFAKKLAFYNHPDTPNSKTRAA